MPWEFLVRLSHDDRSLKNVFFEIYFTCLIKFENVYIFLALIDILCLIFQFSGCSPQLGRSEKKKTQIKPIPSLEMMMDDKTLLAEELCDRLVELTMAKDVVDLSLLGIQLNYTERYLPVLGKLKLFIATYPRCIQLFSIRPSLSNANLPAVSQNYPLGNWAGAGAGAGARMRAAADATCADAECFSDEDSLEVCPVPLALTREQGKDYERADRDADLSTQAFNEVRRILLRETSSTPIYSMTLTALAAEMSWAARFKSGLGSLGSWLATLVADMVLEKVTFTGNPGNSYVRLVAVSTEEEVEDELETAEDDSGGAPDAVCPQPLQRTLSGAGHRQGHMPDISEFSMVGVRVREFFDLPLLHETDSTERMYMKSIKTLRANLVELIRVGILHDCLMYGSDKFEVLEWFGDAVLHLELSSLLRKRACLLGVGGVSKIRINCEQRLTQALVFDELNLAELMIVSPHNWNSSMWKSKGDVLEAIIGELHDVPSCHPMYRQVRSVLEIVVEAIFERGQRIRSLSRRNELMAAASRPGGGGFK